MENFIRLRSVKIQCSQKNNSREYILMRVVHDWCDDNGVTTIGFMCPDMISATMLFSDADNILLYMTHVMEKQSSKRFILCPYHEKYISSALLG